MTSLNPVYTVGDQIGEVDRAAPDGSSRRDALDAAIEMLRAGPHPGAGAPRRTTIRTSSRAGCASA